MFYMDYSIYLTDACNLNCKYCYEKNMHYNREISFENMKKIIDTEIKNKSKESIITFFGGEPLLKKDLIYDIVEYIKSKKSKTKFLYNMTTNGVLIDYEFVKFFENNDFISLSISIDGAADSQNENRITKNGKATYELVAQNAKKMLSKSEIVVAVPVVTKNNVRYLYQNLCNLIEIGFKKIGFQFDFTANWTDKDLSIIKEEFEKISQKYIERMRNENEIHLIEIDEKIRTYIDDKMDCNNNCSVGLRNVNVGTDGNIYPCMQFMYDEEYVIGNCNDGIDKNRQIEVHKMLKEEMIDCKECAYKKRCNHTCSCLNKAYTGNPKQVAPFTCEIERLMIDTADNIAEILFKEKNPVFIQKFYNRFYDSIERTINKRKE